MGDSFGQMRDAWASRHVNSVSGTAANVYVGDLGDEKLDELMLRLEGFLGA
jgi:hypothetical protein